MNTLPAILSGAFTGVLAQPGSLAWRPFVDPLDAHRYWFALLIPMALLITMVYKAVRLPTLERYWRHVAVLSAQIILGIIALGAGIYIFIQYIAPMIAPVG
ncbi:MAG: hypothetical protein IT435_16635 [Phycisphaerales bacterium]|nr:hypothetical protein [Phycisphaerales bacterium]